MKNDIKKQDFDKFLKCLEKAGVKINDPHYFKLPVAGEEEKAVFRERVYCYELYHQLRNVLGENFPYKLDGEVDKRGHDIIKGSMKPDFIVHIPGLMDRNLVVIEVKPVIVKDNMKELRCDLEKLQRFLNDGNYYRAIMLVYGDGKYDLPQSIRSEVARFSRECGDRLLMVWHRGFQTNPTVVRAKKN